MDVDGAHVQIHEQTLTAKLDVACTSSFRQSNCNRVSPEEDPDVLRISQVLEDQVSDIIWKAHQLESLLPLASAVLEEILRSLELLTDYGIFVFSGLGCEGKRLSHVQPVDLDYLWTIGLVVSVYNANVFLGYGTYLDASSLCADLREA